MTETEAPVETSAIQTDPEEVPASHVSPCDCENQTSPGNGLPPVSCAPSRKSTDFKPEQELLKGRKYFFLILSFLLFPGPSTVAVKYFEVSE